MQNLRKVRMFKDETNEIKKQLLIENIILKETIILGSDNINEYNHLYTVLAKLKFYDVGIKEISPLVNTNKIAMVTTDSDKYLEIEEIIENLGGKVVHRGYIDAVIINCSDYDYFNRYERLYIDTSKPDMIARKKSELSQFLAKVILDDFSNISKENTE